MATWSQASDDRMLAARLLMRVDHHQIAASRAYYSMYAQIRCELHRRGFSDFSAGQPNPSHAAAMQMLESNLFSHLQPSTRKGLVRQARGVHRHREIVDYQPSLTVDREVASANIRGADFVREALRGGRA
jgi:uncharacterized protein (UPF0332 family)